MPQINHIPEELLAAYTAIVRSAPDESQAKGHLVNFLVDVEQIAQAIAAAIANAKQRAGQ